MPIPQRPPVPSVADPLNRQRSVRAHQSPWHPSLLLAAPHRLAFFAAALVLAASALWWAVMLVGRALEWAPVWTVAPPAAHALLMTLGFTPLFFVGFLYTAGPRWLGLPEVAAHVLAAPVALMLSGWVLAVAGFHTQRFLGAIGLSLVALGWSALTLRFVGMLRRSAAPERVHATLVAISCCVGALCLWGAAAALALGNELWLRGITRVALWCFVAPVFATVSHRMLPFFSASALPLLDAWRPFWLLGLLLGLLWLKAGPALAELWFWPLPNWVRWAQVVVELPSSLLLLWLAVRWGLIQSMKIRLLAMLHAGFVWLGIAFALDALSHALMALSGGELSLGLAPTHALTMGYLGGTLLAMATRVSAGHSGRALAADNPVWFLYWLLHGAVLLRVAAALWPVQSPTLTLLAVLAWSTVCVGWALRYGNWFGRARVDGKPG
ncbi:MAG: NnrS family protein [Betaproteobacteria bacterium]